MIHRIVFTATMAYIGLMPWVALSILGGETEMPTWLAWNLLALFGLVLLWALGGVLKQEIDGERLAALTTMMGVSIVSMPAMIDNTTRYDLSLVVVGVVFLLMAAAWAVLAKPVKDGL